MYGKGKVKVLADRTMREFNVDFMSLSEGSHHKIYVECERCGETFLRERRLLHQLHACPLHITRDDGTKLKWCNSCQTFLTYKMFSKNKSRYDNLSSICKTCANASNGKNRSNRRLTLDGWMKNFLSAKKSRCKKMGMECEITSDDLRELWEKQGGKCYYSNVQLSFGQDSLRSANLDRIDPKYGYTLNNIVWASKALNCMKNHYSEDDLYAFLEQTTFTNIRLECKLDHKESQVPFRKRITDAGYDVFSVIDVTVMPNSTETIKTGIRVSPPPGWYFTVEGRSSLYKYGIAPLRGIIDATYTGPILIMLHNSSDKPFVVKIGDRVAQIVISKINHGDFISVKEFSPDHDQRGEAGWGSSGGSSGGASAVCDNLPKDS